MIDDRVARAESAPGALDAALEVCRWLPDSWPALADGQGLFAGAPWLRAMGHRIAGEHRWFVARAADGPRLGLFGTVVADADCYPPTNARAILLAQTPLGAFDEQLARDMAAVRERAPAAARWFPNLLFSYPGYDCFPIGPDAGDPERVARCLDGVVAWARGEQLRLVSFLYTGPWVDGLRRALAQRGFQRFPITMQADLELPGSSFDDYLASLPAKQRRYVQQDIRHARKKLRDAGVTVRALPLGECLDAVVGLRCAQRRKYGYQADEAAERRWLAALDANLPEQSSVFLAEADGRAISFCLCVRDGATWHSFATGSDYDDARTRHVYFELIFYRPVEAAYALGIRRISFGHAAEEAKRHRGCSFTPIDGWALALAPELEEPLSRAVLVYREWERRAALAARDVHHGGTEDTE